jgi:hypothetical protein
MFNIEKYQISILNNFNGIILKKLKIFILIYFLIKNTFKNNSNTKYTHFNGTNISANKCLV